jgi:hypothetical protein
MTNPSHTDLNAANAAFLRKIADEVEQTGAVITVYVSLTIGGLLPSQSAQDERVAITDAIAHTLTGNYPTTRNRMGSWEHTAEFHAKGMDAISLRVSTDVEPPADEDPALLRAENERLRAELAAARGDA